MDILDLLEGDDWKNVRSCKWCQKPIVVYKRRAPRRDFCDNKCKDDYFNEYGRGKEIDPLSKRTGSYPMMTSEQVNAWFERFKDSWPQCPNGHGDMLTSCVEPSGYVCPKCKEEEWQRKSQT